MQQRVAVPGSGVCVQRRGGDLHRSSPASPSPPPPPPHPTTPPSPSPPPTNQTPPSSPIPYQHIATTTKLASSVPFPEFLGPYLDHIAPYIASLDGLLASLQLAIFPSTPPKPLLEILPHILVSLGIVSTLAVFMRRFFGRPQGPAQDGYIVTDRLIPHIAGEVDPDPARPEDYITVKHGPREFMLKYPVDAVNGGAVTVGGVRDECSKITNVDPGRISLICAGRNLKDGSATLRSLGISHGAHILLMGSTAPVSADPASDSAAKSKKKKKKGGKKAATAPGTPEPEAPVKRVLSPMEKIDAVWDGIVVNLVPLVEEFTNSPPADPVKRADAHRRLSETMMGELLKLDSVESGDPDVRVKRKGVVKDIQKILDGLDQVLREQTQEDFDLD